MFQDKYSCTALLQGKLLQVELSQVREWLAVPLTHCQAFAQLRRHGWQKLPCLDSRPGQLGLLQSAQEGKTSRHITWGQSCRQRQVARRPCLPWLALSWETRRGAALQRAPRWGATCLRAPRLAERDQTLMLQQPQGQQAWALASVV